MEQSVTRVSGKGMVARVLLVALLSLIGLSVIGVGQASAAAAVVKSISPTTGTANGGTVVTINGSGFTGATAVTFGGVPASFTFVTGIKLTAIAPAAAANGTNPVDVQVTVAGVTTPPVAARPVHLHLGRGARGHGGRTRGRIGRRAGRAPPYTITAAGTWTAGQLVSLGGFTNGLPSAIYTVVTGGSNSFTINNSGTTTGAGTGVVSPSPSGGVGSDRRRDLGGDRGDQPRWRHRP